MIMVNMRVIAVNGLVTMFPCVLITCYLTTHYMHVKTSVVYISFSAPHLFVLTYMKLLHTVDIYSWHKGIANGGYA